MDSGLPGAVTGTGCQLSGRTSVTCPLNDFQQPAGFRFRFQINLQPVEASVRRLDHRDPCRVD